MVDKTSDAPAGQWLSLGQASGLLGVHPSTLRAWADEDHVPAFRTPGGHRRFQLSELEAFLRAGATGGLTHAVPVADQVAAHAVNQVKQRLPDARAESPWLKSLEQHELEAWREKGRRLIALAIQYVSREPGRREPVLEQAEAIGREHAQACMGRGIRLVDMMQAYMFFRESVLRVSRPGQIDLGQYDREEVRIHREMRKCLDMVMYAMLAAYDEQSSPKRLLTQ